MRWVGIDEAGYGPNLGPMVMSAVVAEGPDDHPLDLWGDLPSTVARAGGPSDRLWVDDSKQIYKARQGLDRLDAACLATLAAANRQIPRTFGQWLEALGAGTLDDVELSPWLDHGDPRYPPIQGQSLADRTILRRPLEGASWRIVDAKAVVVGPLAFNAGLRTSGSKAVVHFASFARLVAQIRQTAPEGQALSIRGDKHGGRHFYGDLLARIFPDDRIISGPEGPALSRYEVTGAGPSLTISLVPRADADDGLVALASILSKSAREHWMAAFNAHWIARIPGLKPTAGYPSDATRFRLAIEASCEARGLQSEAWWRAK